MAITKKEKEFETVAKFTEGNCTYTIKQPVEKPTEKELEGFYLALGKIVYGNKRK